TKFGSENVVTIPELMDALTGKIWSEVGTGRSISASRRDLQRAYIDAMTQLIVKPRPRTPADARSVARWQLGELQGRIDAALEGGAGLDAYTRAHLAESRARIHKALEAGLEAEE
ncbi:MAG: peptidase M43, partial [Gemmatimonadota bacterium]